MALLLVGLEGVGQQAVAVARVGVVDLPAVLEHGEAEIGVLDDGVARPAAGGIERGAADQAHGAVHDDGVGLVALDHADVEEAGIFAVHGVVHERALAVAVVLRRLDHADLRIGEGRHEVLEPVGTHHVVGIDDADDLGVAARYARAQAAARRPCSRSTLSSLTNLKRSPSVRQCSSIGSQKAGSGVLLMTTTHSKFGYSRRATASSVALSISGGSR